jgi:hypothetical protein
MSRCTKPSPDRSWCACAVMRVWPSRAMAAALVLVGAAASSTALAQVPGLKNTPHPWAGLTVQQQQALAPLKGDWGTIDAARQKKWLDVAGRFQSLEPQDQARVQQRMADWSRMTPQERGQARLNYQELRQTPLDERQSRWQAYQALPESQKRELAKRADSAPVPQTHDAGRTREDGNKTAVLRTPATQTQLKAVAPTVVQTAPGATTNLVSRQAAPPLHQQSGLPKMAAKPGFVDPQTLLPKRGPQGASVAVTAVKNDTPKQP